jgi:hypothetical protein
MKLFAVNITIILCMTCLNSKSNKEDQQIIRSNIRKTSKEIFPDTSIRLEIKIYPHDSTLKEWGYDIYANSTLFIHQPYIPAVPGNKGFQSAQQAEIAGKFAAYKIRNNIIPPTISIKELDSLGIFVSQTRH